MVRRTREEAWRLGVRRVGRLCGCLNRGLRLWGRELSSVVLESVESKEKYFAAV